MAFKTKTKSRLLVEERQTLDAKHNNILQSFNENKNNMPLLEVQLHELKARIADLHKQNAQSMIINLELQREIWKLDDEKIELEKQIQCIKNNVDENKYMLNTGKILSSYYKILDQEKQLASAPDYQSNTNIISIDQLTSNNTKKKSIMDWFSQSENNNAAFENIDTGKKKYIIKKTAKTIRNVVKKTESLTIPNNTNTNNNTDNTDNTNKKTNTDNTTVVSGSDDGIDNSKTNKKVQMLNKETIYEKYMKTIDKTYINVNNDDNEITDTCGKCNVEMLLNNNSGILICPKCGLMENIIVDSDKPSFKEPPKEMTSFCYKRINHLNEFLAQFQAKETTDIPEDVYNEILMEIKKERITNMALITPEKMRALLKKIKKNDYYEHIPYIINQLNGLPAPVIAPEIEEIIRGMFKAIQIPFEKYCPHKRKNFLSYNYVMYKFFELLELDEYLQCFQLLKSRTKLHQQDLIWKNICNDLNWQFIKSL